MDMINRKILELHYNYESRSSVSKIPIKEFFFIDNELTQHQH